jgi:hypothetical protein
MCASISAPENGGVSPASSNITNFKASLNPSIYFCLLFIVFSLFGLQEFDEFVFRPVVPHLELVIFNLQHVSDLFIAIIIGSKQEQFPINRVKL